MIEVKDRSVQYPNRYQLTTVAGQSNTYDLTPVPGTIAEEGTPVNKALLDQYLAASGTTAGTASALTLAQSGFSLTDGAYVRFKTHTAIQGKSVTLNINGTGAKSLVRFDGNSPALPSGAYATVVYSNSAGKYYCTSNDQNSFIGSYIGNGNNPTEEEPQTLVFPFKPNIIIIQREESSQPAEIKAADAIMLRGVKVYYTKTHTSGKLMVSWQEYSVSWYAGYGDNVDLNRNGQTYLYYAAR